LEPLLGIDRSGKFPLGDFVSQLASPNANHFPSIPAFYLVETRNFASLTLDRDQSVTQLQSLALAVGKLKNWFKIQHN
jgi:hypothetical protein